jgi:hypothetical protein
MLAGLGLAAMLLTGCGTARFDAACPTLVEYSAEDQRRAAAELTALPDDSMIGRFLADYARLRDQVRACQAALG